MEMRKRKVGKEAINSMRAARMVTCRTKSSINHLHELLVNYGSDNTETFFKGLPCAERGLWVNNELKCTCYPIRQLDCIHSSKCRSYLPCVSDLFGGSSFIVEQYCVTSVTLLRLYRYSAYFMHTIKR